MAWNHITSAPTDGSTVIVGDQAIENTAISHYDKGLWWLGHKEDEWFEELDFEPQFWLPANHPTNPFKEPRP